MKSHYYLPLERLVSINGDADSSVIVEVDQLVIKAVVGIDLEKDCHRFLEYRVYDVYPEILGAYPYKLLASFATYTDLVNFINLKKKELEMNNPKLKFYIKEI